MTQNILFVDIETVPVASLKSGVPPTLDQFYLFRSKYKKEISEGADSEELWESKASLHAEFGKIVCISCGLVNADNILKVKTIASRKEEVILAEFTKIADKMTVMCAHNGNEFDFPYLFRRYLINGIAVPNILKVDGRKPWEIPHIDTMKMWGHMQWNYKCSLDLMAHCLGLPSPKKEMSGADVAKVYFDSFNVKPDELPFDVEGAALKKIGDYCAGDLVTLVNVYCKLKGFQIFTEDKIIHV